MEKIAMAVLWRGMSLSEKSKASTNAVTEPMTSPVAESALYHLCREAVHSPLGHPHKQAKIKASVLRERLLGALEILRGNIEKPGNSLSEASKFRQELLALVDRYERKERETGRPCTLNMFFQLY